MYQYKGDPLYEIDLPITDGVKLNAQIKTLNNGTMWFTISKARKWLKDGKFRFTDTVMIDLDTFKHRFLPLITEMVNKVDD